MITRSAAVLVVTIAAGACTINDPDLAARSGAPAYAPSNAMPPTLSSAANDLAIGTWQWQRTQQADGRVINAVGPDRYTLRFEGGGRVLVRADCNRGAGSYEVNGAAMKMGPVAMTRMGCPPDSQDTLFGAALSRVTAYSIGNGELVLTLADGGTMRLRATP